MKNNTEWKKTYSLYMHSGVCVFAKWLQGSHFTHMSANYL